MSEKVRMIKADAIVNIPISARLIHEIQKTVVLLVSEHSDEELESFNQQITEKVEDFSEPWMSSIFYLTLLLKGLEEQAVNQGQTYEQDLDEITQLGD